MNMGRVDGLLTATTGRLSLEAPQLLGFYYDTHPTHVFA